MKLLTDENLLMLQKAGILCYDPKYTTFKPNPLKSNFWQYINSDKSYWLKVRIDFAINKLIPCFESMNDFFAFDKTISQIRFSVMALSLYIELVKKYHKEMPNAHFTELKYISHLLKESKSEIMAKKVFSIFDCLSPELRQNYALFIARHFEDGRSKDLANNYLDSIGFVFKPNEVYTKTQKRLTYSETIEVDLSLAREYVEGSLFAARSLMNLVKSYIDNVYPHSGRENDINPNNTSIKYSVFGGTAVFEIHTQDQKEMEGFSPLVHKLLSCALESGFYQSTLKAIYEEKPQKTNAYCHSDNEEQAFAKIVEYLHLKENIKQSTNSIKRKKI